MTRQHGQFHLLSFEGPDPYARAGGIASRIAGLASALVDADFDPHLWFVGDPKREGHEHQGGVTLHRWCQWISRDYPFGVYDGEAIKVNDYASSLPPYLLQQQLLPSLARGERPVVLAEEWHTVHAVLHLDWLLREQGVRDRVTLLWNANNTFGFEQIDWNRLNAAAKICTVSRYMRHCMRPFGVDPVVIPNGLGPESYLVPDQAAVKELRRRFQDRILLAKVARWDPDKRWMLAVDTVAELKNGGGRPLLIARGGMEAYGHEVRERARSHGLQMCERSSWSSDSGAAGLLHCLKDVADADVVLLGSHLDAEARSVLFHAVDAVLANSEHEPFGLVGLETMAAGGLACTGLSGEDYALDGQNAIVLQTNDPCEFGTLYRRMRAEPAQARRLRKAGIATAREYAWPRVIERALLPRL
jgi:glycosyltransferase involved in cell wall biosynthesis